MLSHVVNVLHLTGIFLPLKSAEKFVKCEVSPMTISQSGS